MGNTEARAILLTVINGDFTIKDDKLFSDKLFYSYGIIASDLNFGKNREIYEKGLLLRDKFNIDFDNACKELDI